MPNSIDLPPQIRKILRGGDPWGDVFPPKPNPPPPAKDGRTVALRLLGDYVCALNYYREMADNQPPKLFNLPREHFFIQWPDDVQSMPFPSVTVVHSRGKYRAIGLTTYVEEDSKDIYGPGTVVQWQGEYIENINLEIWTNTSADQHAMLATLETALSPVEQMSGIRFRMEKYFDELVTFSLVDRMIMDDPDSARRRRRAQIGIEMRFNVVALVNVQTLIPIIQVNTDIDESTGLPVNVTITGSGG